MVLRLITFYQRWVSPALPPRCRFLPSCSEYAFEAIEKYGAARGTALAMKRCCRCHPFHPGGFDPVPEASQQTDSPRVREIIEPDEQLPPNCH